MDTARSDGDGDVPRPKSPPDRGRKVTPENSKASLLPRGDHAPKPNKIGIYETLGPPFPPFPTLKQIPKTPRLEPGQTHRQVSPSSPTPSGKKTSKGNRRWAKRMGALTSDKAAKYIRKSKSSPSADKMGSVSEFIYKLTEIKKVNSHDELPPLPVVRHKFSTERLSRSTGEKTPKNVFESSKTRFPKLEPFNESNENLETQPVLAPQPPVVDKPLPEKPLPSSPKAKQFTKDLDQGVSHSIDAEEPTNEEWPVIPPVKRRARKGTVVSVHIEDPFGIKDGSSAEDAKIHMTIGNNPHETTAPSHNHQHSVTSTAHSSPSENSSELRLSSVINHPASLSSRRSFTEMPLKTEPCLDTDPDSTHTTPMKRASGIPPPIPLKSASRATSSPNNKTRACYHPNTKTTSLNQSGMSKGEASSSLELTDTHTPAGKASMDAKNTYLTPQNGGGVSKIPRASPLSLALAAADPGSPRSPAYLDRRSSIPIPRRLLQSSAKHNNNNPPVPIQEKATDAPDGHRPIKSEEGSEERKLSEVELHEAEEVSIVKVEGVCEEVDQDDLDTAPDQDNGYKVKRLSLTAVGHGPTLRVSQSAEKIIMGRGLAKGKTPTEVLKTGSARRHSWNPKELKSKQTLFDDSKLKSGLTPRSVSSLVNVSEKNPSSGELDVKLKKAKSADLISSALGSSSGSAPQRQDIRRPSKITLPRTERAAYQPSPLRGTVEPASPKSDNSAHVALDRGVMQSPLSRIATSTERLAEEFRIHDLKEATKDNSRSASHTPKSNVKGGAPMSPFKAHRRPPLPGMVPQQHPPRGSSRKPAPDHTINAKSKLIHVTNAGSDLDLPPSNSQIPARTSGLGQKKDANDDTKRKSTAGDSSKTRTTAPKNSISRGMLSNFKGLFGKPKGGLPETSSSTTLRPRLPAAPKNKATKGTKMPTWGKSSTLDSNSRSRFARINRSVPETITSPASPPKFPELDFPGNGDVNALTRDILDSAQRETDSETKLRLIRLGKILVEAVNHSNDAEKSMIKAMQAAKQAEVYSTITKRNVMELGLAVQQLRFHDSMPDLEYDPTNVI